jgi:hypothetical protein
MADGRTNSGHDADAAPPPKDLELVAALIDAQNPDGGWPYRKGTSWTEPTVLSLLAMGPESPVSARGFAWLRGRQRSDGGWSPQAGVDEATWVTSLVALLPPETVGVESYRQALAWIMGQMGTDSTFWYNLRQRLLGANPGEQNPGWPWFPGTAAWVTPTSLAILALRKVEMRQPSADIRSRIEKGQRFLLSRRCADGGWNHGSSRALGYDGNSYPETTGAALLALAGSSHLDSSLAAAERHWRECRSAEGAAWLKLGLLANGHRKEGWPAQSTPRNVRDRALCVLADKAGQGHNAFLD